MSGKMTSTSLSSKKSSSDTSLYSKEPSYTKLSNELSTIELYWKDIQQKKLDSSNQNKIIIGQILKRHLVRATAVYTTKT